MPRVSRELIEHELHLDPKAKPIKQRLSCFTQDKKDVIKKEIARLLDIGFIKKCTTRIGSLIPFLYPKEIKIGGYVSIILILITHAKKIPLGLPRSIRLWTPQPIVAFYVFLTTIPGIIIFLTRKKTKSRHPS
jgi:hypothetical protein